MEKRIYLNGFIYNWNAHSELFPSSEHLFVNSVCVVYINGPKATTKCVDFYNFAIYLMNVSSVVLDWLGWWTLV